MRFIFYCFIILSCQISLAADSLQQRQAFWVVRYALKDEKEIDNLIRHAVENHITDIFVQVRALGRLYYPGKAEVPVDGVSSAYDPLQIILEKAKPYHIRIHAWINMFYIWSGVKEPADHRHPFHLFRESLLGNGRKSDYKSIRSAGMEGYFLDPQNMQVQNYLLNLLQEVADSYSVSGIHLDYFRYPGVNFSFTPENRTEFRINNFFDPLEVFDNPSRFAEERGVEVFQYADKIYRAQLMDELSGFLKRIRLRMEAKTEKIELSVAVKPDPVAAKYRYFQDWQKWLREDSCDFIVIMNYQTDYREFNNILLQLAEMDMKKKIMIGISTYNQNEESVNNRLQAVRNYPFFGIALFSYNHMAESVNYLPNLNLKN